MKKLIWKELREQLPMAVVGLCVFTLLLVMNFSSSRSAAHAAALSYGYADAGQFQPLLSTTVLMSTGFFCGIFGALLGFRQIYSERHPDLWAFLRHRPIEPGAILRSKVCSGMLLYLAGAGIPMLALILVVATPGQVAAPFAWPMALPVVAIFLTGLIFYGGGLLTGLRKARWYVSRGCGLGLPIVVAFTATFLPEFWQALSLLAVAGLAMALAVRGSFLTGGFYRGQPPFAKTGLAITTAVSAALLIGVLGAVSLNFLQSSFDHRYAYYQMTTDGAVIRFSNLAGGDVELTDLAGQPLIDPKTGRKADAKSVQQRIAVPMHTSVAVSDRVERSVLWGYARPARYFQPVRIQDKALWYLTADGRLVAFHGITRQPTGEIRPHDSTDGFQRANGYYNPSFQPSEMPIVLATTKAAYTVNLVTRESRPVFTVDEGDRILGLSQNPGYVNLMTSNQVMVATRRSIQLLNLDGNAIFKIPYDPAPTQYPTINTFFLTSSVPYAVRLDPGYRLNQESGGGLPIKVKRINADGTLRETVELPNLPAPEAVRTGEQFLLAALPPVFFVSLNAAGVTPPEILPLRATTAAAFALIGVALARRNRCTWAATLAWAMFHLMFGLAGMLTFFALQERPASVICPACRRRRDVDREQCEHCEAMFAPPPRNGIEIFEPLRA